MASLSEFFAGAVGIVSFTTALIVGIKPLYSAGIGAVAGYYVYSNRPAIDR